LVAPLIRKSMPKRVLPEPAFPEIKVVPFCGKPPSAISLKPLMPVGHLSNLLLTIFPLDIFCHLILVSCFIKIEFAQI
jgi:hypothetical protein